MTSSASNACTVKPSCARPGLARRPRWMNASTMAITALAMLPQLGRVDASFEYGDPVEVLVPSKQNLAVKFDGDLVDALAISYQQCSGSRYMQVEIEYDGEEIRDDISVDSSFCHRIIGAGSSADDTGVGYDNLCAFQNSGTVNIGYDKDSDSLSAGTNATAAELMVDPSLITLVLTNQGDIDATAQIVMFSTTFTAVGAGGSIDRVINSEEQDGNTFTVEAAFQADGSGEDNFCFGDGCAVYAFYQVIDETDTDADHLFGTSCQAREGIMAFEGTTEGDNVDDDTSGTVTDTTSVQSAVIQSTTSFELEACIQFPKNTAATYVVYMIVSPDTSAYARIGYSTQDQLIYMSSEIIVEGDSDIECPEIVDEDSSASERLVVTPARASGVMAMTLAAAAARAGL